MYGCIYCIPNIFIIGILLSKYVLLKYFDKFISIIVSSATLFDKFVQITSRVTSAFPFFETSSSDLKPIGLYVDIF